MNSQNALNSSAQTGTPSLSFVRLMRLDKIIASSLAKDQVSRELVCTLPIDAMKAATAMEAMKAVAAAPEPVAWNHISYIGTLHSLSDACPCNEMQSRRSPGSSAYCCVEILDAVQHRDDQEESCRKTDYEAGAECPRHRSCGFEAIFCQMYGAI